MTDFEATMIAEGVGELAGVDEADLETQRAAWQHLVNTGLAWKLQGCFGRQAMRLIEAGEIQPAGG